MRMLYIVLFDLSCTFIQNREFSDGNIIEFVCVDCVRIWLLETFSSILSWFAKLLTLVYQEKLRASHMKVMVPTQ